MIENIVTGKKYRVLINEEQDEWDRVSIWTSANDVECENGENIEERTLRLQGIWLTDTLTAGNTSISFTDDSITENCFVEIYTNIYGVSPEVVDTNVSGQLTLVFEQQEKDMQVCVNIRNGIDSFTGIQI